jgi:hypothetical protein
MLFPPSIALAHVFTNLCSSLAVIAFQGSGKFLKDETNFYDIFAALVFGFSTINVLNLATKRFETHSRGLNYGEMLAIAVVIVSIVFLAWEMLHVFHVLPFKLDS